MAWLDKAEVERKPRREPENLWVRCEACKAHVLEEELARNLRVCPRCGHHGKLTAAQRIDSLVDPGSFRETAAEVVPSDPLRFDAGNGAYRDKIDAARRETGLGEAVVTGTGRIRGLEVVLAVMDFRFLGGSLGSATGEKILRGAMLALEERKPYIVVSSSGGARMQEGALSLMQMAKTCAGLAQLDAARLPYISVLTHPTTGGVSASFAMVGDVNIAEPGALIGFAGRRVIEQTIRQKLPDDFQTSEHLLAHGFVDMIVERRHLRDTLALVLDYHRPRGGRS